MKKSRLTIILLLVTITLGAGAIFIGNYLSNQNTSSNDINATGTGEAACAAHTGYLSVCNNASECSGNTPVYSCVSHSCVIRGYYDACTGAFDLHTGMSCAGLDHPLVNTTHPVPLFVGCGGNDNHDNCSCPVNNNGNVTCTNTGTSCAFNLYITQPSNTPIVTTPVVTTPIVTTPVVTTPVVTTPVVTTPVVTTPVITTPVVTTPVITTPPVTGKTTPTIPVTALTTDKGDRIIAGVLLVIVGILVYTFGFNKKLGKLFWNIGGRNVLPHMNKTYNQERVGEIRKGFEKKIKRKLK